MADKYTHNYDIHGRSFHQVWGDNNDDTYSAEMFLRADARAGALSSGNFTLGAITTVTAIAVPFGARGFVVAPNTDVRFAIDEDPAAVGVDALTVGAKALGGEVTVRLIINGAAELRIYAVAGGEVVYVEFF